MKWAVAKKTVREGAVVTLLCAYSSLWGACASTGATATTASAPSSNRPNILFIFTDDHAPHAISAYGSKLNKTPNMDRIANEGMRFDNATVTNSICAPSRAVILTGKHSHINGQYTNRESFDGTQVTFPKLMRKAGYQTAIIGKWHLRSEPTGFDYYSILNGQGPYYNPEFLTSDGDQEVEGYTTDIITQRTIDWLENRRDKDKPFILMSQHKAPHRAWEPGPDHLTMYDDVTIPEPPDLFDDQKARGTAARTQDQNILNTMNPRDLKLTDPPDLNEAQLKLWRKAYGPKNEAFRQAGLSGKELVRWKYQRYIKDYLRAVASVDDGIGKVLDYLDESGLADNTVVIYSSDQGFYLGDKGWFDKRFIYEESFRTPLLVRWPGVIEPGTVSKALVQNLDFAETFLDLAGAEIPAQMQGVSLVPVFRGQGRAEGWRQAVYYHYYEFPFAHNVLRHYGVRTERYKLIHFYTVDEWELYDLQSDPRESKNLVGDAGHADLLANLRSQLSSLQKQYGVDVTQDPPLPEGL